jgi:vacuolar-type H+-ATPase subunit E/Vma4
MGIEKLTGSLVDEAQRESREIVKTAQWHVDKMVKEEKAKESLYKADAKSQVESRLAEQKNERLAWARLEAKRILAESKEDAISNSLEGFFEELKGIQKTTIYKAFLKRAVEDALAELGGKPIVHTVKGDLTISKIRGVKTVSDLSGLGGAIVESSDSSVRIDLRMETIFELQRDALRKEVYGKLFGRG